ncbi:hypothetical protein FA09DRAFT_337666 [Tilletiopsis washingtonensis]|uniref:CinA C-terminal domain-containing protein n=1 Tax=Tilletiopsis washingtonensis TaxID=58919 RepID=A0A316ZE20_9BASI|nr:hypothetical protein FA09DRAFT_337666 [Tilletiopsis washingtonensis]PWN99546.1 hypothetical protein FA09DRAFT_337666 [Tilletiopsis washingtonensis]
MSASSIAPELLARIAAALHTLGASVAVGESSSGGLVSAALLGIDGASAWYKGGAVLYTRESRITWNVWTEEDLRAYRGPTEAVVSGLASRVAAQLGAGYGVGESGIAGPNDIGRRFPAGYTVVAVSRPEGRAWTRVVRTGSKDRVENMHRFAHEALSLLAEVLESDVRERKAKL